MISVLVEPRSARRSSGSSLALGSLLAYAGIASIAAGIGSPGAGLAVIAMGLLAATAVDFVLWREIAFAKPDPIDGTARETAALPPPAAAGLLADPLASLARPEPSKIPLVSERPASPGEPGAAQP